MQEAGALRLLGSQTLADNRTAARLDPLRLTMRAVTELPLQRERRTTAAEARDGLLRL